ncbi:hypothetical protein [Tianweitania sediminis]|uniref:Uncharacterized protein n=1 Tax=Tianweitania sediminis TaxID=1502156 RepID=A0A8J7R0R4_9HYPH|nr:hypothetical protein [Tianweitania sediminis]MBP0438448.1 hypothetical protein [Tianweitania sediminis]
MFFCHRCDSYSTMRAIDVRQLADLIVAGEREASHALLDGLHPGELMPFEAHQRIVEARRLPNPATPPRTPA